MTSPPQSYNRRQTTKLSEEIGVTKKSQTHFGKMQRRRNQAWNLNESADDEGEVASDEEKKNKNFPSSQSLGFFFFFFFFFFFDSNFFLQNSCFVLFWFLFFFLFLFSFLFDFVVIFYFIFFIYLKTKKEKEKEKEVETGSSFAVEQKRLSYSVPRASLPRNIPSASIPHRFRSETEIRQNRDTLFSGKTRVPMRMFFACFSFVAYYFDYFDD